MRKIGEMRIWWLWRKFVEMARVLQKTRKRPRTLAGQPPRLKLLRMQAADGPQVINASTSPQGPQAGTGYDSRVLLNGTTRQTGGALATSYIASVSENLQRSIGKSEPRRRSFGRR